MITQELIKSVAPRARDDYVAALVGGDAVLQQYEIITPLRLAAFMATISHEAGSLTIVRENMNYTAARIKQVWPTRPQAVKFAGKPRELANCVYNGRMGNAVGSDDGWNFRGGGLIQLTGRDSYRRAGLAIGVNLESQPGLIEEAEVSLKAACWEFSKFAALCDKGDKGFRGVCNGINRGNALSTLDPIGWADRQVWYARWCRALGVNAVAEDDVLNFGDQGALVEACQKRLTMLGYANGKPDGIFGSLTRSAVLTFQAENGLTVDGDIGPQTRAVLNSETAKPLPLGDRSLATVADLRAAGSTTIVATDKIKNVGAVVVAASAVTGGVQETGILTVATDTLKELTLLRTTTVGFVDVFSWALSHWYLFAVVGGFFVWKWARDVQWRRLIEHNTGLNLSR